jgi:hypothetical protein
MARRDAKALAEGYQSVFREVLSSLESASLLSLRQETQVVLRWAEARGEEDAVRSARRALDAVTSFYQFGQEVGGFSASNRMARNASVFDLASVGILAIENVLSSEKQTLMRLLMSSLSEGLMFLGSRQYVAGSEAILMATYRAHALAVQDALWALASDFRDLTSLEAIREVRASIDALFARLGEPEVPVATKVALLHQLYGLVAIIRCAKLLDDLRTIR